MSEDWKALAEMWELLADIESGANRRHTLERDEARRQLAEAQLAYRQLQEEAHTLYNVAGRYQRDRVEREAQLRDAAEAVRLLLGLCQIVWRHHSKTASFIMPGSYWQDLPAWMRRAIER